MSSLNLFSNLKKVKQLREEYLKKKIDIYKELKKDYPVCFQDFSELYHNISKELIFLLSSIPKFKTSKYEINKSSNKYDENTMIWRYPYEDFYYPNYSYGRLGGRHGIDELSVDGKILILPERYSDESSDIKVDLLSLPNIDRDKANKFIDFLKRFILINKNSYELDKLHISYNGEVVVCDQRIINILSINDSDEYGRNSKTCLKTFNELLKDKNIAIDYFINNYNQVINGLEETEEKKKENKKQSEELLKEIMEINAPLKLLREI